MEVQFISDTPDAEKVMLYCARVSNPKNQKSEDTKLLNYCIKHGHWSVFEMADLVVEVTTSRAIAAQILRHKSFSFQEFSQRYAEVQGFEIYNARSQDQKNRQNSIDNVSKEDQEWFLKAQESIQEAAKTLYKEALNKGIAKEQARFLLPMSSTTKLYMKGSIRSWITYFMVRLDKSTQLEHREIANGCWIIFKQRFPIVAKALMEKDPEIFI